MEKEEKSNKEKFPSVDLGYDVAMGSYRTTFQRFDIIKNGIDRTLTWMLSFNLGLIVILADKSEKVQFHSWWFYSAILLFFIAFIMGMSAKVKKLKAIRSPKVIFEKWLKKTEWQFKKDSIFFAGQNYDTNKRINDYNGIISDCIIGLFMLEIILLALWIIL